jgi:hypothetical protein
MADLMGVMLKSLGVNPAEITKAAVDMQTMAAEIHDMLSTLIRQNELIIVHLAEFANKSSPLKGESDLILSRMILDGTLTRCAGNYSGDSVVGD